MAMQHQMAAPSHTSALKWAENYKCDSEANQYIYACLAVTQLHQRAKTECFGAQEVDIFFYE